jgi:hypothetical protein
MIAKMFKNWYFTLVQIALYVAVFSLWKAAPGRLLFVVSGTLGAGLMALLLEWVRRRGYFVGRTDYLIHLLITIDLLVEAWIYEIYVLLMKIYGVVATAEDAVHNHNGYYLCAAAFFAIAFVHRYRRLRSGRGER